MKTPAKKNLSIKKSLKPVAEEILDAQTGGITIWGCCYEGGQLFGGEEWTHHCLPEPCY